MSFTSSDHYDCHIHSLRCQQCSLTLRSIPTTSCCSRTVSLCSECFIDDICPDCIQGKASSTGYITRADNMALVKISSIDRYCVGDIVMFHPILERVGDLNSHLNLLHINKPCPFVLLDDTSYADFGLAKGRFHDLIIAKLSDDIKPVSDSKVHQKLCSAFAIRDNNSNRDHDNDSGSDNDNVMFYTVKAKPVTVNFPSSRSI